MTDKEYPVKSIQQEEFTGCYSHFTAFVRHWRNQSSAASTKSAFVPLHFALGEAFQFDWSEEWLVIGGLHCKILAAHTKLCASRAFMICSYPILAMSRLGFIESTHASLLLRPSRFGRLIHSGIVIYTHKRLVKIQRAQVVYFKCASTQVDDVCCKSRQACCCFSFKNVHVSMRLFLLPCAILMVLT